MCAAACSTTGLSEVAMTPFVPHSSAFIGMCMYLGLCVEPQGFVLCFHFSFCFINAHVLCLLHISASIPRACTESVIYSPFHVCPPPSPSAHHLHWFQMKPCCCLHSPSLSWTSASFLFNKFRPYRLTASLSFPYAAMAAENLNVMFWTLVWDF